VNWLVREDWRDVVKASRSSSGMALFEMMKEANSKYVLREWMLVDAYSTADNGDDTVLNDLYDLIQQHYEDGSQEEVATYCRQAPG